MTTYALVINGMTTYALVIEQPHTGDGEIKLYSSAANALDELEWWRAGGARVVAVLRDGSPIDEAALRADEEAERVLDVE